ncbi:putative HNHc nuclease [Carnobacterium sp. ISL-102]|uniref:putative HNHc nuclease n=1 Tax=Carnobacterium sp. ISL-102 TaxID=2819142 RepID=UPI001BE7293C|nr:putative HNHc nuclease [Carnobacterium sp. ISL-102]MBT2732103.1 hypothetical protein [Carnobacterium sp. ISL-102]
METKVENAKNILAKVTATRFNKEGQQEIMITLDESIIGYQLERYTNGIGELYGEFTLFDNRIITAQQRKKIHAILSDIVKSTSGIKNTYDVESIKEDMKLIFCDLKGIDDFSTSELTGSCTVTIASEFITFLLNFCLEYGVPLSDPPVELAEDLKHQLIKCLYERKCAVCWKPGMVYQVSTTGAKKVEGRHELMCLCNDHYQEAESIGHKAFASKQHVLGILMNQEQYMKLKNKR